MKYITFSLATVSLLFIGCGGGGGGGNPNPPVTFPSTSKPAKPTLENGKKVKEVVTTNQGASTLNTVNDSSTINIALFAQELFNLKQTKDLNKDYSLNEVIREEEPCSNGGSVVYEITSNFPQGGTLTRTFNECLDGAYNAIINGKIYQEYSNYDSQVENYKTTEVTMLSDFTMKDISTDKTLTIYKDSYFKYNTLEFDKYEDPKKYTMEMTMKANDGLKQYGLKDANYYVTDNISMYQTKGRVYIDNLKSYVDYDTSYDMSKTPFVFSSDFRTLKSGEARYNMANKGKVKIVAQNSNAITYVDADGDGTYELSE